MSTTATPSASWGDTFRTLLNKGVDTAAAYGAAKMQADAMRKAAKSAALGDPVAAKPPGGDPAPSAASRALIPIGIGVGVLLASLLLLALFRRK